MAVAHALVKAGERVMVRRLDAVRRCVGALVLRDFPPAGTSSMHSGAAWAAG